MASFVIVRTSILLLPSACFLGPRRAFLDRLTTGTLSPAVRRMKKTAAHDQDASHAAVRCWQQSRLTASD